MILIKLGKDPLMQSVSGVTEPLASASTLCRFENQQGRQLAWQVHELLVDTFIASHRKAPPSWCWTLMPPTMPCRGARRVFFSWLLRPLLFFALVCILW